MIRTLFQEAAETFHDDKNRSLADTSRPRTFRNYRSFEIIQGELPHVLQRDSNVPINQYLFKGSIGAGGYSDVPWIGVFNRTITTTAQNGFYLVYLFRADMQGVYLSLNQGYTQYKDAFGAAQGRINIEINANRCRSLLRSIGNYNTERINLRATTDLGRGYEGGNICSQYYSFENFPDNQIILDDLRNFVGLYRELQGLVGNNILDIQAPINEEEFQEDIQNGREVNFPTGPIPRGNQRPNATSSAWIRSDNVAFTALKNADYKCENDESHQTFLTRFEKQFVEAHHLIPMQYQNAFIYSIDVPENVVSLCPNCHRAFHHSKKDFKRNLLRKFLIIRREKLNERGIAIAEEDLFKYYKVNQ